MIRVSPRARTHDDRNGDPLDGLVNLFDIGIVLAVAFLLAALSSLHLTRTISRSGLKRPAPDTITISKDQQVHDVPTDGPRGIGRGGKVGTVYQLDDGRLVYVVPKPSVRPSPIPSADPTP